MPGKGGMTPPFMCSRYENGIPSGPFSMGQTIMVNSVLTPRSANALRSTCLIISRSSGSSR
jgi:hypothetical protein